MINLLGCSRSFYGYTPQLQKVIADRHSKAYLDMPSDVSVSDDKFSHETLYSLLLSLLPSLDHKYEIGCEIEEISFNHDKHLTVLATTLNALRTKAGWNIPQVLFNLFIKSQIIFLNSFQNMN